MMKTYLYLSTKGSYYVTVPADFAEGPCRSTLRSLLHNYEVNFKYKGKI